jgi:hypothetical protein
MIIISSKSSFKIRLLTPPTTGIGEDTGKKEPSYTAGGNVN